MLRLAFPRPTALQYLASELTFTKVVSLRCVISSTGVQSYVQSGAAPISCPILLIFAGSAAEFALNRAVDWLFFTGNMPHPVT